MKNACGPDERNGVKNISAAPTYLNAANYGNYTDTLAGF
jgi:hypothetical protein